MIALRSNRSGPRSVWLVYTPRHTNYWLHNTAAFARTSSRFGHVARVPNVMLEQQSRAKKLGNARASSPWSDNIHPAKTAVTIWHKSYADREARLGLATSDLVRRLCPSTSTADTDELSQIDKYPDCRMVLPPRPRTAFVDPAKLSQTCGSLNWFRA